MSLTGTIVFLQGGVINYFYGLSLGIGFAIGSWIGIGLAVKKGDNYIRTLLIVVMALSLIKLLSSVFNFRF